ncbi:hypothetical protein HYH02_008913 [Chlamydomonas schloesseri]|uniref:Translocon-associated protein subunit beta n=1 Tax=Chlamydomonas schloesseri TaxID=2026947 RepID=A0A835WCT4_9CHLO|nr:hypothetical protein HYH02_008913 [Chlamydomonas schloesseri]|eukprot:KAG2445045.1 hypothetical protein HYH02_008913 [Chlamydomonas schloesseri]
MISRFGLALLLASALLINPIVRADDDGVEDDEYADTARAMLIVRKFTKEDIVVQGKNVTVEVDIFNSGISTASSVKYTDVLPENATLVEGSLEVDFGKVTVGSHVKHSYVVIFTAGNVQVQLPPALVSYLAEPDSTESTVGASSSQVLYVLTPVQQLQRYALQAGAYASLGFARTPTDWRNLAIVIGTIGTALGANWMVKKVKASNKDRQRERAYKELTKDD